MESSRQGGGIQQLLAAEQEAQHIVNEARNLKKARLKQAKEEAEREIAQYRAQVEADFQRKLEETSGDSGANVLSFLYSKTAAMMEIFPSWPMSFSLLQEEWKPMETAAKTTAGEDAKGFL